MWLFRRAERGLRAILLGNLLLPSFNRAHREYVVGKAIEAFLETEAGRMSSYTRIGTYPYVEHRQISKHRYLYVCRQGSR